MAVEIEVERTARILKQAEPGLAQQPVRSGSQEPPSSLIVAVMAGIIAVIAICIALS